jgi:hypothetical protein
LLRTNKAALWAAFFDILYSITMTEKFKNWNFKAMITLPVIAVISSIMAIEVDVLAIITVGIINFIPMLISYLFARFLLSKTSKLQSHIVAVMSPLTISFCTSLWYLMRVINPVTTSPGIEHLAIPQMILIGAIGFGLLSIPLVFIIEKQS